jgi:hypothetical protein
MATLLDEFNAMKIKVAKAMAENDLAALHRKIHIVDQEAERTRRRTNPDKSTKVYLKCYSPENWKRFSTQKDRYFTIAVDPEIAIEMICRALEWIDDFTLRQWISGGHEQEEPDAVAEEDLPDWAKE